MIKKDLLLGILIGFIGGTILVGIISMIAHNKNAKGKDTVSIAIPEIKELNDHYLVKIENYGLSYEDFTNAYEEVKKKVPADQLQSLLANESQFKAQILEDMINQYVIVASAIKEGVLENKDSVKRFRNGIQQTLAQFYIAENMPKDSNTFAPSKPEIDQAYAQFGSELRARGLNAEQSKEYITTQITQQKQQQWMAKFLNQIKEQFRIERNQSLLDKENIAELGSMPIPNQQQPMAN